MAKVYIITLEEMEQRKSGLMKELGKEAWHDYSIEGVFSSKDSAVKKLKEFCEENRAKDDYKNHLSHEVYDVNEHYYVEYDYRAVTRWYDYIIVELEVES